jgi:ATP/ADP translocase
MGRAIPEFERKAVWRLFLYSMILAASYTLARTAGDSLFLARVGSQNLAAVYVASGVSTAAIASIWFALTRKLPLAASLRLSGITFALMGFAAWAALPFYAHSIWLLAAIYLFAEIKGCVNAINVVSAINEILGGHSSRQSWARIGLGLPLAGISVGVLVGIEAGFFSLRSWLFLSAVLDLFGVMPVWRIGKYRVPNTLTSPRSIDAVGSIAERLGRRARHYASSKRFQFWIGSLIATKVAVLTMVSFEWKISVSEFFSGNEQSLARYFGVFYAITGVMTLLLQAFVVEKLLRRRRVALPILVMPVALLVLNTLFVLGVGILFLTVVTTLAKATEVWRRSVHDTTLGFLYTKIEREKRRSAIAFNSGLVKPLAEVSISLVLLFGSGAVHHSALMIATGLWLLSTVSLFSLIARTERKNELRRAKRAEEARTKTEIASIG